MGIRQIRKVEDKVLREKARPVKDVDDTIKRLLADMVETMSYARGVGLAAPQVGIPKQIIVVDAGEGEVIKLVNPCIIETRGEALGIEGCLSIPGIYGEVPRGDSVKVEGWDEAGREICLEVSDLTARVLQHEIDHLHGVLFTDKAFRFLDPEELKEGE